MRGKLNERRMVLCIITALARTLQTCLIGPYTHIAETKFNPHFRR